MNELALEQLETNLRSAGRAFAYPPTPDLVTGVRERLSAGRPTSRPAPRRLRWAWVALAIMLVLGGLMAVPQVRAAVIEFLQIGAIRLFFDEPAPVLPTPTPQVQPLTATIGPSAVSPGFVTPRFTATPPYVASVLDLEGETTLDEAESLAGYDVPLPTYPADLGPPDHVFYQEIAGPIVILVWLEPGTADRVRLTLYAVDLQDDAFGGKFEWSSALPTHVNGQEAYWVEGRHVLLFQNAEGDVEPESARFVEGNVLIWEDGTITYRLETDLPIEEAIRIAESMRES